jgi:hypothetical protein
MEEMKGLFLSLLLLAGPAFAAEPTNEDYSRCALYLAITENPRLNEVVYIWSMDPRGYSELDLRSGMEVAAFELDQIGWRAFVAAAQNSCRMMYIDTF